MKKELLMTLVAFATISASAQVRVQKSPLSAHRSETFKSMKSKFAGVNAKLAANDAPKSLTAKKNIVSIKKADAKAIELTPDYSETVYRYNSLYPNAFVCQCMYEGASHKVDGKKAYLKPYADIDNALVGTIYDGENMYSEDYSADSITFNCEEPVGFYYPNPDDKTKKVNVYLRPSALDFKEDFSGYEVVPTEAKTFGAYYIALNDELLLPEDVILALYAENEDTPIDEEHTIALLDIAPKKLYEKAMLRATVKGTCHNGATNNFEHEGAAVIANSYILIKGVSGINPEAWVMFIAYSEDGSVYYVPDDLMLASTTNNKSPLLFTTVGMINNGEEWNYNIEEEDESYYYPSYYSVTENIDNTYTFNSAQNTAFGEYYYGGEDVENDVLRIYDLAITLHNEAPTAIASVKDSAKQDNAMYNLAGQRINKLQRGINIVNGKKVVKK